MSDATSTTDTAGGATAYRLSTAVFAERDGKILVLKRAMGTAPGSWYVPGGAVEPGENNEDGAGGDDPAPTATLTSAPTATVEDGEIKVEVEG